MRLDVLAVAAVVVVVLAVPTAAMATGGEDTVGGSVELSPHHGPNGEYASISDGELRVDFDALNDEATTAADDVVTISTASDDARLVSVEVAADAVTAYRSDRRGATLGHDDPVRVEPGEPLEVGFRIDTRGDVPDSSTITVRARSIGGGARGAGGAGGGGDGGDGGDGDGDDGSDGDDRRSAEVRFPDGTTADGDTTVTWLDDLPADEAPFGPQAVVEPDAFVEGGNGLRLFGDRLVTEVGRDVRLTARRSYIGEAEAIARDLRVSAVVDITPPPDRRDQPATVRIRIPRDRLDEPGQAAIARQTPRGWQVLATDVVAVDDETVAFEAETPGFSAFAVFARSDVTYEWTLPDGSVVRDAELETSFAEAGTHNVSLRITDAMGRSDRATARIVANDRPTVRIEGAEDAGDGEVATLSANVTNVVGNATVVWTLPDGSTAEGPNVTGAFETGAEVEATVEDEYGASDTARAIVGVGPVPAEPPAAGTDFLPAGLPLWLVLVLAVTAVTLAVAVARSRLARLLAEAGADGRDAVETALSEFARDAPRITAFENPRWNADERALEIDSLAVEAPGGLLAAVEITVTDDEGTRVVRKRIEVGGDDSVFTARDVTLPVYGDVDLSGKGYTVEVRAVDEADRVGDRRQARDPFAGPGAAG